jgi:replication-associated recombination protein RarA
MADNHFDPWTRVRTAREFPADQVISALQKEIRRGNVENAAVLAHEMIDTSPELERKLWDRLCVISVEDVGFGDPIAPVLIQSLEQMSRRFDRREGDRALFAIHAVRYLATRQKDRSSDEMYNWIRIEVAAGNLRPTIPDYALDMHTARGAEMGRDTRHFYEEGANVYPELPARDLTYRQRILESLNNTD